MHTTMWTTLASNQVEEKNKDSRVFVVEEGLPPSRIAVKTNEERIIIIINIPRPDPESLEPTPTDLCVTLLIVWPGTQASKQG